MAYTLRENCYLKRLEEPHIYDAATDELYLLDDESFHRVLGLCEGAEDPEAAELLGESGLLQEKPRRDAVFVEGRSDNPSLRYVEIQITGRCDKACRHCYLGAPMDRDMAPEVFSAILGELSRMQGLKVIVSGGEPGCHPLFREMATLLPAHPLRAVLVTHGEWIGPREAVWLRQCFDQVQVSLDGLQAGHDALRGAGSFERAAAAIRTLRNAGIQVSAGTMVHEKNLDQFETMSDLVRELGVQEWDIDVPCPAGRWTRDGKRKELLRDMSEKIRHAYGGGYHGGSSGLACGSHLMTVGPDGAAAKCGFYLDEPAGNVREGVSKVWRRMKHVPLSELDCDCDELDQCAGGCRFRAEVLEGSDLSPDIVQCYARGVK